jgi:hypothetical protein
MAKATTGSCDKALSMGVAKLMLSSANKLSMQTPANQPDGRAWRFANGKRFTSHRIVTFMPELGHKQGKPKDRQAFFQASKLTSVKALIGCPSTYSFCTL